MKTDGPVRPADHRRLCRVLAVSSGYYWLDRYKRIMFPSSKLIISFLYSFMKWPDSPDDFRHSREDAIKIKIIFYNHQLVTKWLVFYYLSINSINRKILYKVALSCLFRILINVSITCINSCKQNFLKLAITKRVPKYKSCRFKLC